MRPYERSPSRTYGCPSITTTHRFDQCSPASGSVVIILIVLASRNTAGSHPGTALSSARAALASAIDRTNESTARLTIRLAFMFICIISGRYIYQIREMRSDRYLSTAERLQLE